MINVYQIAIGEIPVEIQSLMSKVNCFADSQGWNYNLLTPDVSSDSYYVSDTLRMQLLCDDPNALYCDWDYTFLKPFDFSDSDKPYFGFNDYGIPHFSLMYCNGKQDFFKGIFEEKAKRKIEDVVSWPMKILRDKKHLVNRIPSDCFLHGEYSTKKTVFYAQKIAIELKKAELLSVQEKEVL